MEYWFNGAPVLCVGGSPEFECWLYGAPILCFDSGTPPTPVAIRRRVALF